MLVRGFFFFGLLSLNLFYFCEKGGFSGGKEAKGKNEDGIC